MMFENLKKKEQFFEIWKKKKDPDNLSVEEKFIARSMENHPEYHELWDSGDVYKALNFQVKDDPFFHVTIHSLLERQIEEKNPPVVEEAYRYLLNKGIDREMAQHSLGIILADEIFEMIKTNETFNEERYKMRINRFLGT